MFSINQMKKYNKEIYRFGTNRKLLGCKLKIELIYNIFLFLFHYLALTTLKMFLKIQIMRAHLVNGLITKLA
jgi:hypothetical protein